MTTTVVNDRALRGQDFKVGLSTQTTKDAINTSPAFTPVRRTDGKGAKTISYVEDPSIIDDLNNALHQIQDSFELNAELSTSVTKQSVKLLVQAIHGDIDAIDITATDISATATGFESVGGDFGDFQPGDVFFVTGFTSSSLNTYHVVAEVVDPSEITTVTAPATTEAAGDSVTIKSNRYRNGVTPTYNALQTRVVDLSAAGDISHHTLYNGVVNTLSFEIPETGLCTAKAAMLFEKEVAGVAAISGQTYNSLPTDSSVSSYRGAGTLPSVLDFLVDGESQRCVIKNLTLEVTNGYEVDNAAGCNDKVLNRGQFGLTGSFVARSHISEPLVWRDKSWNATRNSYGVVLNHGNGDYTAIVIHSGLLTDVKHADARGVVSNAECTLVAEGDSTLSTTVTVFTNYAAQ